MDDVNDTRTKIPAGAALVDLHLHLLPGVDDGPPDEAAALAHAARLAADGVHEAVVTPHVGHPGFPVDVASIPERTAELQAALDAAGLPLRLHPGGEVHLHGALHAPARELRAVAQGPPGARWLLVEAPFAGIGDALLDACRRVRSLGLGVLVAHPERAAGFARGGLAALRDELAAGAVLQVSVDSLLGRHGLEAQAAAHRLVRARLAYVMASDGHGGHRCDTMRDGWRALRRAGVPEAQAWGLARANPAFLLAHGLRTGARAAARL